MEMSEEEKSIVLDRIFKLKVRLSNQTIHGENILGTFNDHHKSINASIRVIEKNCQDNKLPISTLISRLNTIEQHFTLLFTFHT